jgi:hypothetical protein
MKAFETRAVLMAGLLLAATAAGAAGEGKRNDIRELFDFENDTDLPAFMAGAQDVSAELAQDNGVTSGKRCARVTFPKGKEWCEIYLGAAQRANWAGWDYFAMDVNVTSGDRSSLSLELFDAQARNYATRCTLYADVVPGKQTVLIRINQPKRNGKEGRTWDELEPQDKINLNALTKCKLFLTPPKNHDLVWWVDNVRLLKDSALGRSIELELPAGAKAFTFGLATKQLAGFTPVVAEAKFDGTKGFSQKEGLVNFAKHWPDPLTGDGVYSPAGKPYIFEVALPDGEYLVWLAAGMVLRNDIPARHFLLKVGDQTLYDETPSLAELNGEKYLFRFMNTPYSERPESQWLDFIGRMYPSHTAKVKVAGGKLAVNIAGHLLSSLIILPAKDQTAFDKMTAAILAERKRVFYATQKQFTPQQPKPQAGDGAYVWFIPDDTAGVWPAKAPNASERQRKAYDLAAAPGQNVFLRLGITPFTDQGAAAVALSNLKGPAEIPSAAARWYFQNFRLRGIDVGESALLPTNAAPLEKGVTRCFWAWLKVPKTTAPGDYSGNVVLAVGKDTQNIPVKLKVYPFQLEDNLPLSFGMWYQPLQAPDPAQGKRLIGEQLAFMREIGFTAVEVGSPNMDGIPDRTMMDLAKAAGMGRNPLQFSHVSALGMGRQLGRIRLGLGATIDQKPGIELDNQSFKGMFIASARKYADFLKQSGFPVAVQTVDEPREMPNPWNRNLAQTCLYGDFLKEAGVSPTWVTPMGDVNGGKDYTSLVDHHDIIATHAGKGSERLMTLTLQKNKTLWLYNTGMDRLSWGFYNWRVGSKGRWEWHFCWIEDWDEKVYLNDEWYNPFTVFDAAAQRAPYATYPGAMLFKSGFLSCAEGITDSAYLCTLEKALAAAKAKGAKAETVAEAEKFLEALKKFVPFLPGVKGIATPEDGALVGQGLDTPAAAGCENWRRKIAEFLVKLQGA